MKRKSGKKYIGHEKSSPDGLRGSCRFARGKIGIIWKFQLLLILIEDIVVGSFKKDRSLQ